MKLIVKLILGSENSVEKLYILSPSGFSGPDAWVQAIVIEVLWKA